MNGHSLSSVLFLAICAQLHTGCTTVKTLPAVTRRTESFLSEGHRIQVETFSPAKPGRYPGVIILHGSSGNVIGKGPLVDLSRELASQGKTAMLVHYFDRTGTVWSGDKAIHQHWRTWAKTVRDSVDFASTHPEVRADAIGIFGFSLGAYLAVSVAADDARIQAVAELSGGLFDEQKPRIKRLPPLLILHGLEDKRVPASRGYELQQMASRLGSKPEMKTYDGEGHVLSAEAIQDASQRTLVFFNQHLTKTSTK
ncbi:dienelactone hydrolase family protein [Prosthecobacter dejongeii]|uniref:Dienelactone hydrolase n=1 Tax=Prosthecobacter dejongeii TaxID=48465 RepID=A0A7W7YNX3_9BACT|nr:dienelactone hydrolase family protein [Prosthecobacter dejongeii]MBB5039643.1 dienelactone hydrolase [Prosthecobacter dejongeii]